MFMTGNNNNVTHLPPFCRGRRIRPCKRDSERTPRERELRFRPLHLCFRFRPPPAVDCSSARSTATRPFGKWRWTGQAVLLHPPCRWSRSQPVDTRCASCPIRFLNESVTLVRGLLGNLLGKDLPRFRRYLWCFFSRFVVVRFAISGREMAPWAGHVASGQEIS